jgi:hypothetical protein
VRSRLRAIEIAKKSGYFLIRRKHPCAIVARGDVLEFGPHADGHQIVTLACRREQSKDGALLDEQAVRRMVESLGYRYRPRNYGRLATLLAKRLPPGGMQAVSKKVRAL